MPKKTRGDAMDVTAEALSKIKTHIDKIHRVWELPALVHKEAPGIIDEKQLAALAAIRSLADESIRITAKEAAQKRTLSQREIAKASKMSVATVSRLVHEVPSSLSAGDTDTD